MKMIQQNIEKKRKEKHSYFVSICYISSPSLPLPLPFPSLPPNPWLKVRNL